MENKSIDKIKFIAFAIFAIWVYEWGSILVYDALFFFFRDVTRNLPALMDAHYYLIDALICVFLLFVYLPIFYHMEGRSKRCIDVKFGVREIIMLTVITFGLGGLSTLWLNYGVDALSNVDAVTNSMESFIDTWSNIDQESYVFVFLSVVLIGPIVEELMFRGIVYNACEKIVGGYVPAIVSGVIFGIWHGELVQVVYTTIMGIGLGLVYKKRKNLWFPIFVHVLNNFLSTLPPSIDTDFSFYLIEGVSLMMILPAIVLLVYMQTQKTEIAPVLQPNELYYYE